MKVSNLLRDFLRSLPFGCSCDDCSTFYKDGYVYGVMRPEHPAVLFKVRDYTTEILGRWDASREVAYVHRGDGQILQEYDGYRITEMNIVKTDKAKKFIQEGSWKLVSVKPNIPRPSKPIKQ